MIKFDKLTQKNQEALSRAMELATELEHQQIDCEHLTYAYLKEENGIFISILERLGISTADVLSELEDGFSKKPSVQSDQPPFVSNHLNKVLTQAQKFAERMKDTYIASEHIFFALYKEEDTLLGQTLKKTWNPGK